VKKHNIIIIPSKPIRRRLPNRRESQTREFRYGDDNGRFFVTVGSYPDDQQPGELFLSGAKVGSDTDGVLADAGVLISRLLQFGDRLEDIAAGMGRLSNGRSPISIIGAGLDTVTEE